MRSVRGPLFAICALLLFAAPARAQAPYEPNDIAGQAFGPISGGVSYNGGFEKPNDEDWFFFFTSGPAQITVTVTDMTPGGACPEANLYDINSNYLLQVRGQPSGQDVLSVPQTGKYYLQMENFCITGTGEGTLYRFQLDPPSALSGAAPGGGGMDGGGVNPPVLPPPFGANGVFVTPSIRHCVSRRHFRIRIRRQKNGVTLISAAVAVNGRRVAVRRGARLTAPVDLRGLPKGRFTVRISALTADGRAIVGKRRYRTCAAKGPSNPPGPV